MAKKRLRMREWLIDNLDRCRFSGTLDWIPSESCRGRRLFRIKWLHASTVDYTRDDSNLFEEWCKHTGKLKESGDSPKRWKANFRCALNSLPDVVQVEGMTVRKGKNAYRVFQILDEKLPEKVAKKKESNQRFINKKLKKRRQSRCDPQSQTVNKRGPMTLRIKRKSSSDFSVETPTDDSSAESIDCNGNIVDSSDTAHLLAKADTAFYYELPLTVETMSIDDDGSGHDNDQEDQKPISGGITASIAGGTRHGIIGRVLAREQERYADFNQDSTSTLSNSMADSSEDMLNDVDDIVQSDLQQDEICSQVLAHHILSPRDEYPVHHDSKNVVVKSNLSIADCFGMLSCQKEDLDLPGILV